MTRPDERPPERGAVTLRCVDLRRSFGAVVALAGVSLEARAGEVHALLGENGAGKSTLMRVVLGAVAPESGLMELCGRRYAPRNPGDARRAGVEMVHQELALAPHLTVAENLALGRQPHLAGWVRQREQWRRAAASLAAVGAGDVDPAARVSALGPGHRQLVEIARAMAGRPRVLILDEPTTSLGAAEVVRVEAAIRAARDAGCALLLVTHHLDEVRRLADRVTVLRDGSVVLAAPAREVEESRILDAMAGQEGLEKGAAPGAAGAVAGRTRLRVRGIRGRARVTQASFELRAGEILGVAGLVGSGRTGLLRVLAGLDPAESGQVEVDGVPVPAGAGPGRRQRMGLALCSEDRRGEGVALRLPVAVNATLGALRRVQRWGVVRRSRQEEAVRTHGGRLRLRAEPWQGTHLLSGGNQQKVALLRLLHQGAQVLLLDEPTRGIDVAAKAQIHAALRMLAAEGAAILVVSSYLPELMQVCDRIAVMRQGVLGPARPATEWSARTLVEAMMPAAGGGA